MKYQAWWLIAILSFSISPSLLADKTIEQHSVSTEVIREDGVDRNQSEAARIYGEMMANWNENWTSHPRPSFDDVIAIKVTTTSASVSLYSELPPPNTGPTLGDTRTTESTYCAGGWRVTTSTTETYMVDQNGTLGWITTSSSWSSVQEPASGIGGH